MASARPAHRRQLYDSHSVPMVLRQYGLGYHGEAGPDEWHLRVFDSGGQRYYLLQDAAPYGYLEHLINAFAAVVISICVLGAFLIGRRVASHVIAPITQLADAVQSGRKPFPVRTPATRSVYSPVPSPGTVMSSNGSCIASNASAAMPAMSCARPWPSSAALRKPCLPASVRQPPGPQRGAYPAHYPGDAAPAVLPAAALTYPGSVPRNKVALRPLIESCMERCQPWISGKPVIVAFDARHDAVLDTNADLAHSVIWNLLRNACQYTERGEVRITLHDTALTVADTGPGLPSSIDPQQFQRFVPGSPHNGEGLGLSIVQRIVEHLGWRMTVHSAAGMPVQPGMARLTVS